MRFEYKGMTAKARWSKVKGLWFAESTNLNRVVRVSAKTVPAIQTAFARKVDEMLLRNVQKKKPEEQPPAVVSED